MGLYKNSGIKEVDFVEIKNNYLKNLVSNMTLDEKIGQLFTVICEGGIYLPAMESLIADYHCGGLRVVPAVRYSQKLFVDKAKRQQGKEREERIYWTASTKNPPDVTLEQYSMVLKRYQELARRRKSGVPLRIAYDQEGGFSRDLTFGGAFVFPPPMGLTATGDPALAYEAAYALGRLGRAVGVNMIHSPVLDVNVQPDNPEIYTRAYSDDPERVTAFARETLKGFRDADMIATAKHFPGRGDSLKDAHFEIPVIDTDWATLWERELYPYRVLIQEGLIPVIMTAHTIYPAVDPDEIATLSEKMLKGVLRGKLGFEGVITTDAIGMKGVTLKYDVPTACVKALTAGADMLLMRMSTDEPIGPVIPQTVERIKQAVSDGRLDERELDEKVYRILNLHEKANILRTSGRAQESIGQVLADPRCIGTCRARTSRSVAVCRIKADLLPLPKNARALVVEQRVPRQFCPNNGHWYHGMFYDQLCRFSNELSYIETGMQCSEEERRMIFDNLDAFDLVIATNWYYRDEIGSNTQLVQDIIRAGKKVIVVGDTPYEKQCIPKEADTAVVQFGVTPYSIGVTAEILFGEREPQAVWPISYRP